MARMLKAIGFSIFNGDDERTDLSGTRIKSVLKRFYAALDERTVALVYFSGHGIEGPQQGESFVAH